MLYFGKPYASLSFCHPPVRTAPQTMIAAPAHRYEGFAEDGRVELSDRARYAQGGDTRRRPES